MDGDRADGRRARRSLCPGDGGRFLSGAGRGPGARRSPARGAPGHGRGLARRRRAGGRAVGGERPRDPGLRDGSDARGPKPDPPRPRPASRQDARRSLTRAPNDAMAIQLLVNAAPDRYAPQVAAAVMAALGRRPQSEEWTVSILSGDAHGCLVRIERPDGGVSSWRFHDCGDDPIRDTIREDLRREGYSWP